MVVSVQRHQSRAGYRGGLLGDRAAEPGGAVSAAEDQDGDGEPGQLAGRDAARGDGEVVGSVRASGSSAVPSAEVTVCTGVPFLCQFRYAVPAMPLKLPSGSVK